MMTEQKPVLWASFATDKFGGFTKDDITADELGKMWETRQVFQSTYWENTALQRVGVFFTYHVPIKEGAEHLRWWSHMVVADYYGQTTAHKHNYFGSELKPVWFDAEKRVFMVKEWTEKGGLRTRQYRIGKFFEKVLKTYELGNPKYADKFPLPTVDELCATMETYFPDLSKYKVEILDKPSEMYFGNGISSCMQGEEYVKFYDTAPCKGIVVRNPEGATVARALLWDVNYVIGDDKEEKQQRIGRIYTSAKAARRLITDYAKQHGIKVEDFDDCYVVCPISEHGLPYQDNMDNGGRVNNQIILADSGTLARVIVDRMRQPGDFYKRSLDVCWTNGGYEDVKEPVIKTSDGTWSYKKDVVEYDGVIYNYSTLPRFQQALQYTYTLDTVGVLYSGDVTLYGNTQFVGFGKAVAIDWNKVTHMDFN